MIERKKEKNDIKGKTNGTEKENREEKVLKKRAIAKEMNKEREKESKTVGEEWGWVKKKSREER